jgi:hypothetical protein
LVWELTTHTDSSRINLVQQQQWFEGQERASRIAGTIHFLMASSHPELSNLCTQSRSLQCLVRILLTTHDASRSSHYQGQEKPLRSFLVRRAKGHICVGLCHSIIHSTVLTSTRHEPCELPSKQIENDAPHTRHEWVDSSDSAILETSNVSPSKDSPSRRKNLMGSLRKRSLRSIESLRNLRSPTSKTKQVDRGSPTPSDVRVD